MSASGAIDRSAALASYLAARRTLRLLRFLAALGLVAFGAFSIDVLDIPVERILGMLGPLGRMVGERLMPPDLAYATAPKILHSVVETVEMSLLGAFVGTIIAIPLAWFAAWNVTPARSSLYPLSRAVIVLARAVPSLMWGMLLVAVFGFGPFAGTITLTVGTIGFAGKLMAEQIEAIDICPVEAIRATGANRVKVFIFSILPQVKPAWFGITVYNWDSRLRSSTILGFVGAGGIGLHLREQISLLEYQTAMGIIVVIIGLVIGSEMLSYWLRNRFY